MGQYNSSSSDDSDSDENPENLQYRNEKSSSSSSSSSESSDEGVTVDEIKKKIETPVSDNEISDSDEEETNVQKKKKKKEPLKVKGEFLLDDLPPIEDLKIQVDEKECLEMGVITSIVDQLVLAEAYPFSTPLDIDSILFIDHGKKALGQIFDVIGPVSKPIYCIRFNSNEDIIAKGISVGDKVFCAPRTEYTSYVVLSSIMGKGSDASWKNDVEPPESLLEYSDDEQERKSKRSHKNQSNENAQNFNRPRRQRFYNHQPQPQQQQQQQNYPMSWHQQLNFYPAQHHQQQNNFNSFPRYDRFFQQQ